MPARIPRFSSGLAVGTAAGMLVALLEIDNLLLLRFLGFGWGLVAPAILAALTAIAALVRAVPTTARIGWGTLALCGIAALIVLLLGGEGRWFYATPDWQVRDAVLTDLATHRWPFAYATAAGPMVLRAPLGMYLLPALAGPGHETALLIANAVRLALLLAVGSALFAGPRRRWAALAVMLAFSGWDAAGLALRTAGGEHFVWDHIEQWNAGLQYSANLTLAFWAPNHALAGWTLAALYAGWRRGLLPLGLFAAALPLSALWSPLAVMGAAPFAVLAGIETLSSRVWTGRDMLLAALGLGLALPALAYEHLASGSVAATIRAVPLALYWGVLLFEVLPFAVPPLRARTTAPGLRRDLALAVLCLMAMPLGRIGIGVDFQMRASIMPLALVALAFAEWLIAAARQPTGARRAALAWGLAALAIGAITPGLEVRRALSRPPSPRPLCSLVGVWPKQTGLVTPPTTYLAPRAAFPLALGPIPLSAGLNDPARCWERPWQGVSL